MEQAASTVVKKRINKWDNAKFGLIFLVAFGHLAEGFCDSFSIYRSAFLFTYTFHMPAFIFLSGLMGKKLVDKPDRNRLVPLLITCFVLHFLRFFSVYISDRNASFRLLYQSTIAWFLFALAAFYLLAHLLRGFSPKYVLCCSVLLAAIAGYDKNMGAMFSLSRIITYFPFFYLGYVTDEKKLRGMLGKLQVRICGAIVIIAYALICITKIDSIYVLRPLLTGLNHYYKLKAPLEPFWGGCYRILYYVPVLIILLAFLSIVPDIHIPVVSKIGRKTISVYFWHLLFIQLMSDFTPFTHMIEDIGGRSILLMIPIALILVYVFSLPPFTTVVDLLMHPKIDTGRT